MLMSCEEIDILRLLWQCRCADRSDLEKAFSKETLDVLLSARLIRKLRARNALVLTEQSKELLKQSFDDLPEDVQFAYRAGDIDRRIRLAQLTLTAYRAGLRINAKDILSLQTGGTFFLPSVMRKRGMNPWSSSRVGALLRLGDQLCAAHYVCPDIGSILLTEELNTFTNNTAQIKNIRRSFLFAGESYETILAVLKEPPSEKDNQLVSYADAYRKLRLPVHLLPCNDTGALQLQIMATPDYRKRLTLAALKAQYAEAPKEQPEWDAMFRGMPFVMAADMDIKRLGAAIKAARAAGQKQVALACLEEQARTVYFPYYRDKGLARVFILADHAIEEALGHPTALYVPKRKPYETKEGDVIYAPLIQTARKAGRPHRE